MSREKLFTQPVSTRPPLTRRLTGDSLTQNTKATKHFFKSHIKLLRET